jgi:hypothetical protein
LSRISISAAAFEGIAATMPVGALGYNRSVDGAVERHIWLAPSVVNRLRLLRGPGESYSDVIIRLAVDEP